MAHTLKNIKMIFLVVLHIKLFVLIINLARELLFTEEILEEYDYCKALF